MRRPAVLPSAGRAARGDLVAGERLVGRRRIPQHSPARSRSAPTSFVGETMSAQGSAGNVIAALCSFFVPGLGQLIQGRLIKAVIQFVLAGLLWIVLLGWLIH